MKFDVLSFISHLHPVDLVCGALTAIALPAVLLHISEFSYWLLELLVGQILGSILLPIFCIVVFFISACAAVRWVLWRW